MQNPSETAVVFLIFNRPKTTKRVFDAIAAARPRRLLVIADGPRSHVAGEEDLCARTRAVIEDVDWPVKIERNYADSNLGCRERVISGLNWAFSLVDEALILEDDCLPDPSFFPYCQELLLRFRDDSRIGMVSGNNFMEQRTTTPYSYYFSRVIHIWGWATWRRAWQRYDRNLRDWPELRDNGFAQELFRDRRVAAHWTALLDRMHRGNGPNTWDIQWAYTCFIESFLAVVPRKNLVENIGFGPDATHTVTHDPRYDLRRHTVEFPLRHPPAIYPSSSLDQVDAESALPPSPVLRTTWRLKRLFSG